MNLQIAGASAANEAAKALDLLAANSAPGPTANSLAGSSLASSSLAGSSLASSVTGSAGELIDQLRHQIRKLETAPRSGHGSAVSTGASGLDQLLPEQGLARGTVTEWYQGASGSGAEILSLIVARNACYHQAHNQQARHQAVGRKTARRNSTHSPLRSSRQESKGHSGERPRTLVVVDLEGTFYPPAAVMWGIDLNHTIVIRDPACQSLATSHSNAFASSRARRKGLSQVYWAIQQALQCDAVGAVWGCLPELSQKWSRRFQLATEQHGTMGCLVRSDSQVRSGAICQMPGAQMPGAQMPGASHARAASWAEVQWSLEAPPATASQPTNAHSRRVYLKLLRARGAHASAGHLLIPVEIDFTTGALQTAAAVPAPAVLPVVSADNQDTSSLSSSPLSSSPLSSSNHETHSLHLATQLAHPATRRRPTGTALSANHSLSPTQSARPVGQRGQFTGTGNRGSA